jgi:hypothetical protein
MGQEQPCRKENRLDRFVEEAQNRNREEALRDSAEQSYLRRVQQERSKGLSLYCDPGERFQPGQ